MFDDLLAANRRYAAEFSLKDLPVPAARGFGLITCMDTRIDPLAILGLRVGDAKILRNAGGRVTPDVLRSMTLATSLLEVTHIAVMHHTGCALAGKTDAEVFESLPEQQREHLFGVDFLAMPDPDTALEEDVRILRSWSGMPASIAVEGWRYDVHTGRVARLIDKSH
ncbi:MAG TPA: carbonic anhydrase [Acidimicrobiales bacterium]